MLRNVDLNLLKVLDALLRERSVTRAGALLGRSQPAVSNALNRLRKLLHDDLLVSTGKEMVLTPRAEALQPAVRAILASAETSIFQASNFDPAKATGVYRISMPDRLTLAIVPSLLDRLQKMAPGVGLHVETADRQGGVDLIDQDKVDVALGWFDEIPRHHASEFLGDERFYCVCRRNHPLLKGKFTMDAVLSFPHLLVSASGRRWGIFDDLLKRHGKTRRTLVSVTNFAAVPHLLQKSDMVGAFTDLAANVLESSFKLVKRPLPLNVGTISITMIWHSRNATDRRNEWLRNCYRFTASFSAGFCLPKNLSHNPSLPKLRALLCCGAARFRIFPGNLS